MVAGALSSGIDFATNLASALADSPRYASETLLIITHLTSGGFYDHVVPPKLPDTDPAGLPYGARVPFLALGPFVRKNQISHAVLEHSSLTKFVEWNWLDGKTGQLGGRDGSVNNLGSLFDPAMTGHVVP